MKCKDCTYWEKEKELWGGKCSSEKFVYKEDRYSYEVMKYLPVTDDMLEYGDYEGYSAYFYTGPEFGCIHFSER